MFAQWVCFSGRQRAINLLLMAAATVATLGMPLQAQQPPAEEALSTDQAEQVPAEQVPAEQVTVPISTLELANWIDDRMQQECERREIPLPEVVDDGTFIRRAYLDLIGTIPSVAQVRDFLEEKDSFKRQNLVDRLLRDDRRPEFYADRSAEHFARIFRRAMIPRNAANAALAPQFDPWLEKQFAENVPYDEMARQLVIGSPTAPPQNPLTEVSTTASDESPQAFYQAIGTSPVNSADAVTRYFLGVRLTCAQCHDHPFSEWKQEDFWGMAAFFSPAAGGQLPSISDETGRRYQAQFLWNDKVSLGEQQSPRAALANWLVSPKNPNFSATAVNRIWQHLCGRGLVPGVDDLDRASPEERAVLDDLGDMFAESGFNVQWLVAGICKSKFYQRRSTELGDANAFARMRPLKTLTPEQLFDTLEQALALPIGRVDNPPRYNGLRSAFVSRMDEAASDSPANFRGGIPQALMIMNGTLTADATDLDKSRTLRAVIDAPFFDDQQRLEALYLATLTRSPSEKELDYLLAHLDSQPTADQRKQAFGEILWSLLNSPEFTLIR